MVFFKGRKKGDAVTVQVILLMAGIMIAILLVATLIIWFIRATEDSCVSTTSSGVSSLIKGIGSRDNGAVIISLGNCMDKVVITDSIYSVGSGVECAEGFSTYMAMINNPGSLEVLKNWGFIGEFKRKSLCQASKFRFIIQDSCNGGVLAGPGKGSSEMMHYCITYWKVAGSSGSDIVISCGKAGSSVDASCRYNPA